MRTTLIDQRKGLRRRLEDRVRRFLDAENLWTEGKRLLVAVSGGPDSTALLLILSSLASRKSIELVAVHFDHQLRGPEAASFERETVESLTIALEVPLVTGAADVRALARDRKLSIEDAARRARYAFLAQAAREFGCSAVATGHTASDQAETVLLHVLRGAGLNGLAGMAPKSRWPLPGYDDLSLVRPLLPLSRADTLAYCDAAGVIPVEDASNTSTVYRRNRVRHELLPALRELNPRLDDALIRLADAARVDGAYIDSVAAGAVVGLDGGVELARTALAAWPEALRRHALRLAVEALLGDAQGFGQRHYAALERLALKGKTGDRLDLPRGASARLGRASLVLEAGTALPEALPEGAVELRVPGEARFGPLSVVALLSDAVPPGMVGLRIHASVANEGLVVRRRRPGDRLQPAGMEGTKKLQDLLVDAHVPRSERDLIPIFESDRGIVAVGALRVAGWAQPRDGAPTVVLAYRLS